MSALYVIAGIVGLLWIGVCSFMAYHSRADRKKSRMWMLLAGIGLIPLVLSILRPGSKGDTRVIEVKPHERTVAPTPDEQAALDAQAGAIKEKADNLQEEGAALDEKAVSLDAEKEKLDVAADKTDKALEKIKNPSSDPVTTPGSDPAHSRKPDPRISNRIRG